LNVASQGGLVPPPPATGGAVRGRAVPGRPARPIHHRNREEQIMIQRLRTLLCLSVAALLLAVGPAWAAKDTLVVAFPTKFDSLDQYASTQRENINLGYLIWDTLVERDPKDGSLKPSAAESWRIVNPTTWEFKLHSGMTFHNGNPVTAESVRFTLMDWVLNEAHNSPQRGNFKWVQDVEVVDDLTFRIKTAEPYPLVLERLNTLYLYDPEYYTNNDLSKVSQEPMGSGPYEFVEWRKGDRIVLKKNPHYWRSGVPAIPDITIRIIPESSTRISELLAGGIDVAQDLIPDQVEIVQSSPDYLIKDVPILRVNFWQFDASGKAGETPVTDVRVRRAIWHAIDRQATMDKVLQGYADATDSPVNPHQFGYDPSVKGYEYNPEKAKQLLADAGYPNGFELDLWQYTDIQNLPNQAAMAFLDQVGIKVNLHDYRGNVGQVIKLRNSGKITGIGNFAWGSYNIFDADAILPAWFRNEEGKDYAQDAELDAWLEEARSTVDAERRKALYAKAQHRIIEQAYWMPFFIQHQLHAHHKDLKFEVGLDEVPRYQYATWVKGAN